MVLRLAQKADSFGLPRHTLGDLIRFLQSVPRDAVRYRRGEGVNIALTVIEEAIERARGGEDFTIGYELFADGRVKPTVSWTVAVDPEVAEFKASIGVGENSRRPDATLALDAGRLIRALLAALKV